MSNHKQSLGSNEYQCDMCHQVYNKGWSEEEAQQETQQYWPDIAQEDCAVICDNCYQQVRPETHPDEYKASLQDLWVQQELPKITNLDDMRRAIAKIFEIPPWTVGSIETKNNDRLE